MDTYDETTRYDADALAHAIALFIVGRGGHLATSEARMSRTIRNYIRACQWWGADAVAPVSIPTPVYPEGWAKEDEVLWKGWLHDTFLPWDWESDVLESVFGTDHRAWEQGCNGWREGLFEIMLERWVLRDVAIVERYDPHPRLSAAEKQRLEEEAAEKAREQEAIDPYLADQGSRRRRR